MWARRLISKANHKQDINAGELRAALAARRVDLAPRVVLYRYFFVWWETFSGIFLSELMTNPQAKIIQNTGTVQFFILRFWMFLAGHEIAN